MSSWRIRRLFAFLAQANVRALNTLIGLLRRFGLDARSSADRRAQLEGQRSPHDIRETMGNPARRLVTLGLHHDPHQ